VRDINRMYARSRPQLDACPGRSFNGLTEPARTDIEFACQVNQSLSGGAAIPAFKDGGGGELRSIPARVAVSAPILMVLGHGSPAEIRQRVDVPSCRAMTGLFSRLPRPVKGRQHKSVHVDIFGLAVLAQRHHQVSAGSLGNGREQVRTIAPPPRTMRRMPAAHPAEVRHVVPVLEPWCRQPALKLIRRIGGRRVKGLLDKQVNSPVLLCADPVQGHRRASRSVSPLPKDPAGDSALAVAAASYRAVQAADPVPVADFVQPFPAGNGKPALGRSIVRIHCGLLDRSAWSGPGSGVCSTVRAAIAFLPILADSLAISGTIRRVTA